MTSHREMTSLCMMPRSLAFSCAAKEKAKDRGIIQREVISLVWRHVLLSISALLVALNQGD